MKKNDLGADAAAVVNAEPVASAAAPHVAHTPGPWRVRSMQHGDEIAGYNVIARDADVARAHEFPYFCIESKANAHLIAAAPELLEALKIAVDIADDWIHSELGGTSKLKSALDALTPCYDAIAKAEGK